jgi:hypothetical protein
MIIWELWIQTTMAMAPHLMFSIVGIKVPQFIALLLELLKYAAINNNDLKLRKLNLLMGRDLFLKI